MVELSAPRWKETVRALSSRRKTAESRCWPECCCSWSVRRADRLAGDLGAFDEGLADGVPDLAGLVFVDALDGDFERGAAGGGGDEEAGVPGLAAAFGVEGGAVERDLPELRVVRRGVGIFFDEADVGDASGELEDGRVVVEALGGGVSVSRHQRNSLAIPSVAKATLISVA